MNQTEIPQGTFFDYNRLLAVAKARATQCQRAAPFPHMVLDDFLPRDKLERVCQLMTGASPELAAPAAELRLEGSAAARVQQRAAEHEFAVAPLVRRLLWELNSGSFLRFLGNLTGIQGLMPDPMFLGCGLRQLPDGSAVPVCADTTPHPIFDVERRIDMFIYLNRDWREENGGHLQLWTRDRRECARRLMPRFGRCVIIGNSGAAFYGHPEPVHNPPGGAWKAIRMHYYSLAPVEPITAGGIENEPGPATETPLPAVE